MSVASEVMQAIHATNVYAGFTPVMAPDWQGWNSQHGALTEAANRATIILDVGTWKGASTAFLAKILKQREADGCVIGIDTFLGSVEHSWTSSQYFSMITRRHGLPVLYEQFLTNMVDAGVSELVVPLAQTSTNAAELLRRLNIRADMIHIDAAHDYESVLSDARAYWKVLRSGGSIIGDDYGPSWPGVIKAADEFAGELGLPLRVERPKWIIERPR